MAVNITKTTKLTGPAGSDISFSDIRSAFGGSANNVKASDYLRNVSNGVDWDDNATLGNGRVPDAEENESVPVTAENWNTDKLRNTITEYVVTQSGTDTELAYNDEDTVIWNGNLDRSILKKFVVDGIIHADNVNDDALTFDGDLYNLQINVSGSGAIYGEGGAPNGNGGDALYVNNTYTQRDVEVQSFGKIWSGGGGGSSGNSGNSGPNLTCKETNNFNYNASSGGGTNYSDAGVSKSGCQNRRPTGMDKNSVKLISANPNAERGRCRGSGTRRGSKWRSTNFSGYQCSSNWTAGCEGNITNNLSGGDGGAAGNGGSGKGWSNRNVPINSSPHIGNPGGSGDTTSCPQTGGNSQGNSGNKGNDGGTWGQNSAGSAGAALKKKGTKFTYFTENTVKGNIQNI